MTPPVQPDLPLDGGSDEIMAAPREIRIPPEAILPVTRLSIAVAGMIGCSLVRRIEQIEAGNTNAPGAAPFTGLSSRSLKNPFADRVLIEASRRMPDGTWTARRRAASGTLDSDGGRGAGARAYVLGPAQRTAEGSGFDRRVEERCLAFYAAQGRPGIPPEAYFRMPMIGYFEGLESQRGFAHTCETGAGRRSWLQGLVNVFKRYVIHAAAYHPGVIPRNLVGVGAPRSLQGRAAAACAALFAALGEVRTRWALGNTFGRQPNDPLTLFTTYSVRHAAA